ncbi:MAG: hypothetical protein RIS80_1159 [Actinomycetota bacterium]
MPRRLLVIGDVIDDIIVMPVEPIRDNTDTTANIQKTLGGSASNVAAWAARSGAEVGFVGCVNDEDVQRNLANFASFSVEATLQTSSKPTGSIVVLVDGESRSMLTDRGANQDLSLAAAINRVPERGIVYLSGYALLGKSREDVGNLIRAAHAAGALVAIDPGSTGYIADYGVSAYRELLLLADVLFPNREEADLLAVVGQVPLVVVTDGPRGATAHWRDGRQVSQVGVEKRSVDPTGAGDAFCGAFLATIACSESSDPLSTDAVAEALSNGVKAGAEAVAIIGARPALAHP